MVASRSRWRFFGQVRRVLLFSQMYPSLSSNHTGFSCTDPSTRLVATTIRIGSVAIRWTAGLSPGAFLPAPAIDGAGHTQRLDLDLDPAGAGILIVAPHVAMREMVDMLAAGILGPVDHAALHLRPAPHGLGIDQQQRDARVALQVLEPAAIRSAVDPEGPVLELEPHRDHLHTAVLAAGADDGRKDLLGEFLHL